MAICKTIPWSIGEVKTFLCVIADERIQRELNGATRNKKVYQKVSKLLGAHGYQRTFRQCREKFKKLKGDYRSIKEHNDRISSNKKSWKWFDQMDAIYRHRSFNGTREGGLDPAKKEADTVVIATAGQKRSRKRSLPNKDDDGCKSQETKRAEVQIRLAEEQITLIQLQQTKARLEFRLLKAGLSENEEL